MVKRSDRWYSAVLQWCGGWRLGVGEGGRGLVPVSACDLGFGSQVQASLRSRWLRLIIVVLGDPWYFAVCGTGVAVGCVAVGACVDWTGFRLVFSGSVRSSGGPGS